MCPAAEYVSLLRQLSQPIVPFRRPLVVLVAWGNSPANAAAAMVRGRWHADEYGFRMNDMFVTHTPRVQDAILFAVTASRYERREVDYGAAWWLVHHSAVNPRDLENARILQRRMGRVDEYAPPPNTVTLDREPPAYAYPFSAQPRVTDRRLGLIPARGPVGGIERAAREGAVTVSNRGKYRPGQ